MKLSDEQLANPDNHGSIARAQVWCGNHYEYPLIADMARELIAARKVVEAARNSPCRHSADTDGRTCLVCKALTALDEATKGTR